jgi:single-stranded-DNA-specific exonuclease
MQLRWKLAPNPDSSIVNKLSCELKLPLPLAKVLVNRGYATIEKADQFLNPKLEDLCDPYSLREMDKAVERIITALRENEKIMIFGDYDVDGITATALMFLVLNKLGANVSTYLPNRLIEGYGLSEEGIAEAERRKVSLMVSVDCGVTALKEIEIAKGKGIDCIVTDHHEPADSYPDCAAVVNPKHKDVEYAGGELSGVGVAFKFAQALYRKLNQEQSELEEHLDLVALGTAADIVPLTGENRILTKFGLTQIARTTKPGLKSLIFISGLMGKEIGTGQIVFILAPRINAVGRLGDAEIAIKLLTTKDEKLAAQIARLLDEENRKRKNIDEKTLEEALELIEQTVDLAQDKAIVLASSGWHQGVIGIVASRIVERFHRPTVMIAIDGKEGKGSARSIRNFHLYEALKECQDCLIRYGGHKYAAGLSIDPKHIDTFREKFKAVSEEKLNQEDLIPDLEIDAEIELNQMNDELIELLEKFAPFGPQNMRPTFLTSNVEIDGYPCVVGTDHLKVKVKKGGKSFDAIGFGMGEMAKPLSSKGVLSTIVYGVEKNNWNDIEKIQLRLKDIKIKNY